MSEHDELIGMLYREAAERIEALEQRIEELEAHLESLQNRYASATGEIEQAQQRIEELEAQQRWIPVSERLPDSGGGGMVAGAYNSNGDWVFTTSSMSPYFLKGGHFTHWMPLPPPPESNDE